IESLLRGGKTIRQLKEEFEEEDDPRGPLLEMAQKIASQLSVIRRLLQAQTKGARGGPKRHPGPSAEKVATDATKERQHEGHAGSSDRDENLPSGKRKGIIEETLIDSGVMESTAKELAANTINDGLKYVFADADLETPAFFSVKPKGGAVIITLNTNHAAYKNLVEVLENDADCKDPAALHARLSNAMDGLKLLLMAWARYEDEQPDGIRRTRAQEARTDWGSIARKFLEREG